MEKSPSKIWYIAHAFLWVVSGFVCYIVWRDQNKQAAKMHLVHSLWLPIIPTVLLWGLIFAIAPEEMSMLP